MSIIKHKKILKRGQLSKNDIEWETKKYNGLRIHPLSKGNLKASSYDISPTAIAMSTKLGMLETVFKDKRKQYSDCYYIYVKPKDTVLIVSNEYLSIPEYMAGYVTSRVSNVVLGFGHISTTIDPNWNGAALIALSNPSNRAIKIYVGINAENPLATVTFHYLNTPCDKKDTEATQRNMRVDLLKDKMCYKNRKGIRATIRYLFHPKRRKYTDLFFEYVEKYDSILNTKDGWNLFLKNFSSLEKDRDEKNLRPYDFVVKENIISRLLHIYTLNYPTFEAIFKFVGIVFFVVLVVLFILGKIDRDTMDGLKPLG